MTSNELLEQLRASEAPYRARAERRWKTAPRSLTDYDLYLLGEAGAEALLARERGTFEKPNPEALRKAHDARDTLTAALRPKGIAFRTSALAALNEDVIHLCMRHGLRVKAAALGGRACAHQSDRMIEVPPVTSEHTYAIALHEIGHIIAPSADSRQYAYEVTEKSLVSLPGECGAWRWAVKHAGPRWSAEMQDTLVSSMTSYAKGFAKTDDDRSAVAWLIRWAAEQVTDRPLDPARLQKQLFAIYE